MGAGVTADELSALTTARGGAFTGQEAQDALFHVLGRVSKLGRSRKAELLKTGIRNARAIVHLLAADQTDAVSRIAAARTNDAARKALLKEANKLYTDDVFAQDGLPSDEAVAAVIAKVAALQAISNVGAGTAATATPAAAVNANFVPTAFFRSPLTFSRVLLETALAATRSPLVRPPDPSAPVRTLNITNANRATVVDTLKGLPQFQISASMGSLSDVRGFSDTPFIRSLLGYHGSSPDADAYASQPRRDSRWGTTVDGEDEDGDDFGEPKRSEGDSVVHSILRSARMRRRAKRPSTGARFDDEKEERDAAFESTAKYSIGASAFGGGRRRRDGPSSSLRTSSGRDGIVPEGSEMWRALNSDNYTTRFEDAENIGSPIVALIANVFYSSRICERSLLAMGACDLAWPVNFLIVAPFIEHTMSSTIIMKAGPDTMATFFGNSNFAFGVDVNSKIAHGNYTMMYKPWAYKPGNIVRADDVSFGAYHRGNDNSIFTERAHYDPATGAHTRSNFVFMLPKSCTRFPKGLDLSGVYHVSGIEANDATQSAGFLPHYPSAYFYSRLWGFHTATENAGIELGFLRSGATQNTMAFPGAQIGPFGQSHRNQGHLGHTYEGCAGVRNGQATQLARESFDVPGIRTIGKRVNN